MQTVKVACFRATYAGNDYYGVSGEIGGIDRTAPTLTAIADNLSGIDSYIGTTADRTPDFSFTSDEAGVITYTGSCIASETTAVSGTNTVTFNTLTYAAYTDCAVTVTDEAGNAGSLAVPDFTLDAAATPITVTGPDNTYATGQTVSAVSSVTDADETWEYQLIDGNTVCDSATTGTFTAYTAGSALTYGTDAAPSDTTDTDDGKKVCFKLTDTKGTAVDTADDDTFYLDSGILRLDNTAPTLTAIADNLSGIDSYIGTTADRTPDFSFTSDEAGVITYTGSCIASETTAVSGTNTVTFNTLTYAAYTDCTVIVTDEAENAGSLAVPDFTLDAAATPITVTGPDNTYATGQTVSAVSSVTDADETWEYQLIDGNTVCDSTTTGTFTAYTAGSALTYGTDAAPSDTTDTDDGKKVCFKLTDTKGTAVNTADDDTFYLDSGILRLDNTAPTLTAITDDTPGGDTTIGGTSDTTPELAFTIGGLRSGETATLLWTGDCTAENNSITSQTDAATDETITVTLNAAEDGEFTEGTTVTGCQVTVRDQTGNESASLSIPSFTIVSPAPVFTDTVNAVTYRKGSEIPSLDLPGLRPDTGHGNITFTLTDLPVGTGLTFTTPATANGTGSLTGTPNQADADASPFTLTYTATDSAPSPVNPRVVTLTFEVTVSDFAVTVADDADGSAPERTKEIIATTSGGTGTDLQWDLVSTAVDCTAANNPTLSNSWTSGSATEVNTENANTKVACFRATYAGNDYYGVSGEIGGIDRTAPTLTAIADNLSGIDSYIGTTADRTPDFFFYVRRSGSHHIYRQLYRVGDNSGKRNEHRNVQYPHLCRIYRLYRHRHGRGGGTRVRWLFLTSHLTLPRPPSPSPDRTTRTRPARPSQQCPQSLMPTRPGSIN